MAINEIYRAMDKQDLPPNPGRWLASFGDAVEVESSQRGPTLRAFVESGQPLPLDPKDAPYRVLFDGVLYNRTELIDRFAKSSTATVSDSDLVCQAYLCWGEDVLRKIKGIFALLIWDGRRHVFLCARDALGIYPLFYADTGGELLFSTSIEALIRHPRVSGTLNRAVLADYLLHRSPKLDETFFLNVKRVPPGHALRVSSTGRQIYRYWQPALPGNGTGWVGADGLEEFSELLDQAVSRCLELGPAGIYLSGGLDSVSVAAVMVAQCRRKALPIPWALSLVFPHPDCNEELLQRRVADGLGLPHTVVPFGQAVGPRGLLLSALEMSSQWPAPLQNVWNPAYHYLGREGKREGCQVILTGGGGDEWLTVTPVYAADLLRTLDIAGLARLLTNMWRSYRLPRFALMRNVLWTNGARLLLRDLWRSSLRAALAMGVPRSMVLSVLRARAEGSQRMPAWVTPDPALRREIEERMEDSWERILNEPKPQGFYFGELQRALDHPLTAMEFEEVFESGRRLGLPILQPFWDVDLVDLLCRIPPDLLNRGGRTKGLVREALARRFPALGFERQTKVTSIDFFRSTILREGRLAWDAMGGAPALADVGVVDPTLLGTAIEDILANAYGQHAYRIWDVLNLEAWLRPRVRHESQEGCRQ